jgi:hypothetical protein
VVHAHQRKRFPPRHHSSVLIAVALVRVKHNLAVAAAVVAFLTVVAGSSAGGAPKRGLFAPGESLGGVRIGMTKADVLRQ